MTATILIDNCMERMAELPDNSVDSIVTDPPYELGFMGKCWDKSGIANNPAMWAQALRVLKPGGHLVAFSGTRTYHRMACAIEDAGFEIRDQLAWAYGSGFPKSHDVSKAIDKAAGVQREVVGIAKGTGKQNPAWNGTAAGRKENSLKPTYDATAPATEAAREWQGWGTALKPAWEPICLARKPISEKNIAANVLKWGAGALNIDATRIEGEYNDSESFAYKGDNGVAMGAASIRLRKSGCGANSPLGRWPANICHDGSDEVLAGFPAEDGQSAARYFYCAKASREERGEGNNHPTVKPVALMQWLIKLVTPKGGLVLDPFMGSGSTGVAADGLGHDFIGIDLSPEYAAIAESRIRNAAGMFADVRAA